MSVEKTVAMLLKTNLSSSGYPTIRVRNCSVKNVTEVGYLGIRVGESFLPHFNRIRLKVTTIVGNCVAFLALTGDVGRRVVRATHWDLLVACAACGAPIWYRAVTTFLGQRKILTALQFLLTHYRL